MVVAADGARVGETTTGDPGEVEVAVAAVVEDATAPGLTALATVAEGVVAAAVDAGATQAVSCIFEANFCRASLLVSICKISVEYPITYRFTLPSTSIKGGIIVVVP